MDVGRLVTLCIVLLGAQACSPAEDRLSTSGAGAVPDGENWDHEDFSPTGGRIEDRMLLHLRRMQTMTDDEVVKSFPSHSQMLDHLLLELDYEVRAAGGSGALWTATLDSAKQDLDWIEERPGSGMRAAFGAHEARVLRLIEMHRSIVGHTTP